MLLCACASAAAAELVWISVSGEDACVVDAEGSLFALPSQEAPLREYLRYLSASSAGAIIAAEPDRTGLTCWSAAMAATQDVGFRRVGLIALPEDAGDR